MILPLGIIFLFAVIAYLAFIVWGGTNIVKDDVFILDENVEEDVEHQKKDLSSIRKGLTMARKAKKIRSVSRLLFD